MARIYRTALVVTFLAVGSLGVCVMVDGGPDTCQTDFCCVDCESAAVARVIDGDTLLVGRRFRRDQRVRLYGVDAPERGERCAAEATSRLRELAGDSVRLQSGPRAEDVYERRLYYLFTDSGDSIDELLVREGLVRAWTRDGQHRESLVKLERQSRNAGIGCLW